MIRYAYSVKAQTMRPVDKLAAGMANSLFRIVRRMRMKIYFQRAFARAGELLGQLVPTFSQDSIKPGFVCQIDYA